MRKNASPLITEVLAKTNLVNVGLSYVGVKSPRDCTLFGDPCTPENPLGSCMVSSEGACAAYYSLRSLSRSYFLLLINHTLRLELENNNMSNNCNAGNKTYSQTLDLVKGKVEMVHGSGGKAMAQLIDELFLKAFSNKWLEQMNDQACFQLPAG